MRHSIKINSNHKRSFCYYNKNGKRVKIYNGKKFNKNIFPNREKNIKKRKALLKELKEIIYSGIYKTEASQEKNLRRKADNAYDQSIFKERIALDIYEHPKDGSKAVALEISELIKKKQSENKKCILGLATGSSPLSIYSELIRLHKEDNLSFKNVITFNLDEYLPMDPKSKHSYNKFMYDNLFNHIDIQSENINIPRGDLNPNEVEQYCIEYENKINSLGGIDFQLLGIGRNGHIGFNEPGSLESSITRKVNIEYSTRFDAADEFGGIDNVPKEAISMGIKTIINAKRIVLEHGVKENLKL